MEEVIKFEDWGKSDLDIRSRDLIHIFYKLILKNRKERYEPVLLVNVTTRQSTRIYANGDVWWDAVMRERRRSFSKI